MRYILIALLGISGGFAPASVDLAQAKSKFPSCDDTKVLNKVVKRFNKTEKIYWDHRNLVMTGFSDVHFHSENQLEDSPIARRYCHATVEFENGKDRRMHYLIEKNAGFAGFGWNVEYCIHGLDPWKYYDGRCRVLSH